MSGFGGPARRTLSAPVTVRGIGIHTGASVQATLVPAREPGAGVVFRVAGTQPESGQTRAGQEIPARAANVVGTGRCTVLGANGTTVATVEHLMSALAAAHVTDCGIDVEGPELPIGDGSARIWTDALAQAGTVAWECGDDRRVLTEPLVLAGKDGAFVAAYPSDALRLTVAIHFDHPLVGTQVARWDPAAGDDYAAEIAPARTFGFIEEVEALLAAGLARGGSQDNAVVIYPDRYEPPLRFPNELARHKLLDLLGDLALVGAPFVADIIAVKPGHRLNTDFARRLAARFGAAPEPAER